MLPGFSSVLIKPETCGLSWANGSVPTPLGSVDVSWKVEDGKFTLEVTIPVGTTARIEVHGKEARMIVKGYGDSGPKALGILNGKSTFEVATGSYTIISMLSNRQIEDSRL